jgi:hypothetical protein
MKQVLGVLAKHYFSGLSKRHFMTKTLEARIRVMPLLMAIDRACVR